MNFLKIFLNIIYFLSLVVFYNLAHSTIEENNTKKMIRKGKYLSILGDCSACHTDKTGGKEFSGGLPMETPFGTFYTPNITSDKDTGIGKWNRKDFYNAMHFGISPKGKNYFPVFPYPYFSKISKNDVESIRLYLLNEVKPVRRKNKNHNIIFPFNIRFLQYGWKFLFFNPKNQIKFNNSKNKKWNRGHYIVEGLGHCSMCHTPMNILGASKEKNHLTGNIVNEFWASNISGDRIKNINNKNIINVFTKNKHISNNGKIIGPMKDVNKYSLSKLKKYDLYAIAAYLKSTKSIQPTKFKKTKNYYKLGKRIYIKSCSICHSKGIEGAPMIGDKANWKRRYLVGGKNFLYKNSIKGFNSMPTKGNCIYCSDNDIKNATDFILANTFSKKDISLMESKIKK